MEYRTGSGVRRGLLLIGGAFGSLMMGLLLIFGQPGQEAVAVIPAVGPAPFELPCTVAGTPLVAEQVNPYYGNFMEDGLDRQVSGVASVVLRNTSDQPIAWAEVVLQGQGENLVFQADHIPAGGVVMVLEKDAKLCPEATWYGCRGRVLFSQESWMDGESLEIVDLDVGTLRVANLTDKPVEEIRIYYKTYAADSGVYIGGITYFADIPILQPGEAVLLCPEHYTTGNTRILRVRYSS